MPRKNPRDSSQPAESERIPAFVGEEQIRAELLPSSKGVLPKKAFRERLRDRIHLPFSCAHVLLLPVLAGVIFIVWYGFLGPGKPLLEDFLVGLVERSNAPTETALPATEAPQPTPSPALQTATLQQKLPAVTTTPAQHTSTATSLPTATPTATREVEITGCAPALSVTLADLGREMCVTGSVLRTEEKPNAFLIILENPREAFYFLSYDRSWDNLQPGTCVFATGEIMQLGNNPVMVLSYNDPLEFCP